MESRRRRCTGRRRSRTACRPARSARSARPDTHADDWPLMMYSSPTRRADRLPRFCRLPGALRSRRGWRTSLPRSGCVAIQQPGTPMKRSLSSASPCRMRHQRREARREREDREAGVAPAEFLEDQREDASRLLGAQRIERLEVHQPRVAEGDEVLPERRIGGDHVLRRHDVELLPDRAHDVRGEAMRGVANRSLLGGKRAIETRSVPAPVRQCGPA